MSLSHKPMTTFLEEVAADLYQRYGCDVSRLRILFPSRRAQLFFTDALSRQTNAPIWQPQFETIDRIMTSITGLSSVALRALREFLIRPTLLAQCP